MRSYGNLNLQKNELQNAVFSTLSTFPTDPKVGQVAFVNSIVYICVNIDNDPVWVPLTREITAYTHVQANLSQTWNIIHNLNTTSVNVQIYDSINNVILPDNIQCTGPNSITVSFSSGMAGRAVCISGHYDGNTKPVYAYTHYQQTASTQWVIPHGLGYNPIVRIFIGSQEIQPNSIIHNSTSELTISFQTAQAGYARLL